MAYLLIILLAIVDCYLMTKMRVTEYIVTKNLETYAKIFNDMAVNLAETEGSVKLQRARIETNEKNINELMRCEKERANAD